MPASDSTFQDLDQSNNPPPLEAPAGWFAPALASKINAPAGVSLTNGSEDSSHGALPEIGSIDIRRVTGISASAAKLLGQNISIQGNGTEIVGGVERGVDRIATEIIRRLEKERTLVVWAFDASGSLQAERERLVKHIDAIYAHIVQLDDKQRAADGGLLTMVEAFGNSRHQLLKKPTATRSDIIEAIKNVPLDTTGNELTFTTVSFLVRQWGRYKNEHRQNYRTMIIVVTDEVGDDDEHVEEAIKLAQSARVPVYVLGSQAIFGRTIGHVDYVDPKT